MILMVRLLNLVPSRFNAFNTYVYKLYKRYILGVSIVLKMHGLDNNFEAVAKILANFRREGVQTVFWTWHWPKVTPSAASRSWLGVWTGRPSRW